MDYTQISKYLSLILRHKPHVVDLTLDKNGWANVGKLIDGVRNKYPEFDISILEEIVMLDEKGRYSFNEQKTKIRANQGHSVNVDVGLKKWIPTKLLYHGTGVKSVAQIENKGLLPMSRLYVHLSDNFETAWEVGKRHGVSTVYQINTAAMHLDGMEFYISVNGVYLTKEVPPKYLKRVFGGI